MVRKHYKGLLCLVGEFFTFGSLWDFCNHSYKRLGPVRMQECALNGVVGW